MSAMKQEAPERREIEELLPWHAAGTLSRRDAQHVEEALARDPELARRYALVREEFGETIHLNENSGRALRACGGKTVRCDRCRARPSSGCIV